MQCRQGFQRIKKERALSPNYRNTPEIKDILKIWLPNLPTCNTAQYSLSV